MRIKHILVDIINHVGQTWFMPSQPLSSTVTHPENSLMFCQSVLPLFSLSLRNPVLNYSYLLPCPSPEAKSLEYTTQGSPLDFPKSTLHQDTSSERSGPICQTLPHALFLFTRPQQSLFWLPVETHHDLRICGMTFVAINDNNHESI